MAEHLLFQRRYSKPIISPTPPDFYYVAAMSYNVGPVVKQFRDAALTGPIIGGDGYDTPDLVSVAGAAADALMDTTDGTEGIKKGVTIIAIKNGKFTLGAEVVPEKSRCPSSSPG
jgi:hypothetical protein